MIARSVPTFRTSTDALGSLFLYSKEWDKGLP